MQEASSLLRLTLQQAELEKELFKRHVPDSNNTLGRSPVSKMPHFFIVPHCRITAVKLSIAKCWISSFSLLCCSGYLLN